MPSFMECKSTSSASLERNATLTPYLRSQSLQEETCREWIPRTWLKTSATSSWPKWLPLTSTWRWSCTKAWSSETRTSRVWLLRRLSSPRNWGMWLRTLMWLSSTSWRVWRNWSRWKILTWQRYHPSHSRPRLLTLPWTVPDVWGWSPIPRRSPTIEKSWRRGLILNSWACTPSSRRPRLPKKETLRQPRFMLRPGIRDLLWGLMWTMRDRRPITTSSEIRWGACTQWWTSRESSSSRMFHMDKIL